MDTKKPLSSSMGRKGMVLGPAVILMLLALGAAVVFADIPTRVGVQGTVPNPGTQQQELANLTFPAPYNVYEFVGTCMACHGGGIDQQAGHGSNWAGSNMASAGRDPVFRANQIIVNNTVEGLTGKDGTGNMCMRCHSPNGWYSGRFDPNLNGKGDASQMYHSILISTDDEGIPCEMCHRTIGNVTFKRADLDPNDPVWNMMADIDDWPHAGGPYVDQAGDPTMAPGNPYGDTTLQIMDGMSYNGRYPGYIDLFFDDVPLVESPPGTYTRTPIGQNYTGQTYGVYPAGWENPPGTDVSGEPVVGPDGAIQIQFEVPIGPPIIGGQPCYDCQAVSLEHPTFASNDQYGSTGDFIQTSEFCGTCHDLVVPVLDHGMPEQRTYTEWKFSDFGTSNTTCQSCHMPRMKHEYTDTEPFTLNVDPALAGWFPYAKARENTSFHKFVGANRDLPMMMKELYPEVDLELIGAQTGNDPRIFPGMLSDRSSMWDRAQRNTEISLMDGVDVSIVSGPTYNGGSGKWEVQVQVTNNTGHSIPSGYPDGRRLWVELVVTDDTAQVVYESGVYDDVAAELLTDSGATGLNRALTPQIDDTANAVMIYERVTGTCNSGTCTPSVDLLNDQILFDNRIPPAGFDYTAYRNAGVKFWVYNPTTMFPSEDLGRYTTNSDLVTYTFSAPPTAVLSARAELYWQTHTREFLEHLRTSDTSTVRPEGPPSLFELNYPLVPKYLSDEIDLAGVEAQLKADGFLSPAESLNDNWGGIAYAAWYLTGKGEPYPVGVADTSAALPIAPANLQVLAVQSAATGLTEPFSQRIDWDPVADADGYLLSIRYGAAAATSSWDKLAVVLAPDSELLNTALNVGKTYCYKVQAYNGAGYGPETAQLCQATPSDIPAPPDNLVFTNSTMDTITMSWADVSDNEDGWMVLRQDVPINPDPAQAGFTEVGRFPSTTVSGGVPFVDGDPTQPGLVLPAGYIPPVANTCYNYVVEAYNASGNSGWNTNGPIQMCTQATPAGTVDVTVSISSDDAEERLSNGSVSLRGWDLEMGEDRGNAQMVGMRFQNVGLPKGANISAAYVVFTADETWSVATDLMVYGEAADNPETFTEATGNVSGRPLSTASVAWNAVENWTAVDAQYQSASLVPIIQELVDRPGWVPGASMVVLVDGTGTRTAVSVDRNATQAPRLHIEYGGGVVPGCYALTLTHTGNGLDPVANPANSAGCPAGQYAAGDIVDLTAAPDPGWAVAGWAGTDNNVSTLTTNQVTMPAAAHLATVAYTQLPVTCYALTLTHTGLGLDPTAVPANSVGCAAGQYVAGEVVGLTATPDAGSTVGSWTGTDNDASTAAGNQVTMPAAAHTSTVNYVVQPPVTIVESSTAARLDDAEERISTGSVATGGVDLELGADGSRAQLVGMRFPNLAIPNGATITDAWIIFTADETWNVTTNLNVYGQAADNAPAFSSEDYDISARPQTAASVAWNNVAPWTTVHAQYNSPGLASVVQEIVNRGGWASGNALVMMIDGTGTRTAESWDGEPTMSPKLHVEYSSGPPPTCYALTLNHTGTGLKPVANPANSAGCAAGQYVAGEVVGLTASPAAGWSVSSWNGTDNDGSTATTNQVTMPAAAHTSTVNYVQIPVTCYALTLTHTGLGLDPAPSLANSAGCAAGEYVAGEVVGLTATPDAGWSVGSWTGSDNDGSTATTNQVTMPATAHTSTVNYVDTPPVTTIDVMVASRDDDAEERIAKGTVTTGGGDLELGYDGNPAQLVGVRFLTITIPNGATITDAWLTFTADEVKTATADLTVYGQAADSAPAFSDEDYDISTRPQTAASVAWNNVAPWNAIGAEYNSPGLASIVQEIVNRGGWAPGNALVFMIDGTGTRTAESWDGAPTKAPKLHVEYSTP